MASRTYNKLPDREYGMALPGVPTTQAIAPGETGHLVFLVKSSRYRTNVAFAGTSAQRGTVRVKLRDASGALIGEGTKELLPNGQTQIDRVFDALGAPATTVARAEVTSDVPVVARAVSGTGDPFAVLAQRPRRSTRGAFDALQTEPTRSADLRFTGPRRRPSPSRSTPVAPRPPLR
ncbi:MAG: hypothetical protein IPN83_11025 [Holophagales bacterium]|nr:hypothetical protein [Holophagales bacterium]